MNLQQLKKELLKYDKQVLIEVIIGAVNHKRDFKNAILEKLNEQTANQGLSDFADSDGLDNKIKLNDALLLGYWKDLKKIVVYSNKYGGCPYKDQNKASKLFEKMDTLLNKEFFSDKLRLNIMQEVIEEEKQGNSGFEDDLLSLLHALCVEKEDWVYLVKYLQGRKSYSDYYQGLARNILKDKLKDEKAYLESAQKSLKYGDNYFELGKFYEEKGEIQQAIQIMQEGLDKADGNLSNLFYFLFDYYKLQNTDIQIDNLLQKALSRKSNEFEVAKKVFQYYESKNYEKAKNAFFIQFNQISHSNNSSYFLGLFNTAKDFLTEEDYQKNEENMLNFVQKRNGIAYLDVLLWKNEKKAVLEHLLSGKIQEFWMDAGGLDRIAQAIQNDFPNEMKDYFWQKALKNIDLMSRDNYIRAVEYLKIVRNIYKTHLQDEKTFYQKIMNLREIHKRKVAFIEESGVLIRD